MPDTETHAVTITRDKHGAPIVASCSCGWSFSTMHLRDIDRRADILDRAVRDHELHALRRMS